jgi:hypothetical protein
MALGFFPSAGCGRSDGHCLLNLLLTFGWLLISETSLLFQGISGFLDFIHRPVFEGTRRFGNWICFRNVVFLQTPDDG